MIYSIVGTDIVKREKAYELLRKEGVISSHIYSEQIAALESLVSASSLFGDAVIVNLIQTMEVASVREEVIRLLPQMKESLNIFIIDEPFADANRVKSLTKYSEKLFDARLEKEEEDSAFTLATLFVRRDKKGAWVEWMRIRDTISGESISGILWWKFQMLWSDVKSGKPSKFSLDECETIGGILIRSSIKAHRGEADLKVELEKAILAL